MSLGLATVGKRGSLVLPAEERRKAQVEEGDRVEVTAQTIGVLLIRKAPSLKEVQTKMAGRLPQWTKLEGKADRLLEGEVRTSKKG